MLEQKVGREKAVWLDEKMRAFLTGLVEIRSYSNEELAACTYALEKFEEIPGVSVKKLEMDNSIREDPLWCPGPVGGNDYTGHFNLEIRWPGTGEQKPIYLNAHMDTVFASKGDENLLHPTVQGDTLFGLGACDDKGGVAVIYTVFWLLSLRGEKLPFDVVGHLVVEEEIGGNGALAVARRPLEGQAAIVMEPTDEMVQPAHRAGLWLKMECEGVSTHTAAMHAEGLSGFELALRAIERLREMHETYREECRQSPPRYYEDYLPAFNVGMFHTGEWPATVPRRAVVQCSVGVLPNLHTAEMKKRIADALETDEMLRGRVHCTYVFERDWSVLDFSHPLVTELAACVRQNGMKGGVEAMKCMSDKYFYQELCGIPTVNFGPGEIRHAHSGSEQVRFPQVLACANSIHDFFGMRAGKGQG